MYMKVLELNGKRVEGLETVEQWHGMTKEDLARPGAALLVWLTRTAVGRGHKMSHLAAELGVTYGYLIQLKKGIRQASRISNEFIEAAAKYLLCPTILVKIAAGQISMQDFLLPKDRMENKVDAAVAHIAQDPDYLFLLPPDVESLPHEVKSSLVLFYQEATGKNLLASERDWSRILGHIRRLLEVELTPTVVCRTH
jgi:hypothetical protein